MMPLCEICRCRRWARAAGDQRGMLLVGMIVVLFLISSLVVAMMSQSTSTAFSLAYENSANRAYYVAESGFRYAAARIRHGADMKSDLHLHATDFSMANSAGSFALSLFPHYLKTAAAISGTTVSGVDVPGGYDNGAADAMAFSGGSVKKVRILAPDGTWDDIHTYTTASLTASQDGTTGKYTATVTLTGLSPSISLSLPGGTVILPVAQVDGNQTTVGSDGGGGGTVALNVVTQSTAAFPRFNGTFRIEGDSDGVLYAYEEKVGDTLTGITVPLDPTATPPYSFGDGAEIVLERFVRIQCTGTYRNASRALTFHMPLATPEVTVKFDEDFQNLNDWNTNGSSGGFVRENLGGGDKRLRVDSVSTTAVAADKAAQIQIKSGTVEFEKAWKYGNKGFLSYDAQVKVGFDTTSPAPADGTASFGEPAATLPSSYMAGINFRSRDIVSSTEKKSYGLSFMRGPGTSFPINANLVPSADKHLLVLWQQTGATAADLQWLAYMDMNPTYYSDDMETTWAAKSLCKDETEITWTNDSNWSINTSTGCGGSSNSWRGYIANSFFVFVDDRLYTGNMDLSHTTKATLKFCHKYQLRSSAYGWVYISKNGGGTWYLLSSFNNGTQSSWGEQEYDISAYLPSEEVQVLFRIYHPFAFMPGASNWFIDDVRLSKEIPVQESTLAVRSREAPAVVFSNGTGTGFEDGDLIYEDGGRLHGIVDGEPMVTAGDWTSGATGLCLLRSVDYESTKSGTSLKAIGSNTTATLVAYGERENLIRAFIADPTGEGSTSDLGSALDYLKSGYPRRTTNTELNWPPEEVGHWPASLDYFSLVQWDGVNASSSDYQAWSAVAGGTAIAADSFSLISATGEPNAVIRTNALVSPSDTTTTYSHSELGLHAFGDGAENTYFDDFGVKLDMGAQYRYAPIVQE